MRPGSRGRVRGENGCNGVQRGKTFRTHLTTVTTLLQYCHSRDESDCGEPSGGTLDPPETPN